MSTITMLKIHQVETLVAAKKSSIYEWIKKGIFPAPYRLGDKRAKAWRSDEIEEWIKALPKA